MSGLRAGDTFAGYRIERVLGRGGMGTVYLAQHPRLPRSAALKLLDVELSGDDEIRTRFIREADFVAQLEHPNIVAVHDRGVASQFLWIAMQYVAGSDAASAGVVGPERAARIMSDTAAALDYAHRRGVLHRDVKPANILLANADSREPERALLADFGIARLRDDAHGLTRTGTFTATLAFASPEQLSGIPLDHHCDQYSLACTVFALLTGNSPFAATNPVAVIEAQMRHAPPSLTALRPDLPPGLDGVLRRALAKRPVDRFTSCGEFAYAFGDAARMVGVPAVVASAVGIRAPTTRVWPSQQLAPPVRQDPAPRPAPTDPDLEAGSAGVKWMQRSINVIGASLLLVALVVGAVLGIEYIVEESGAMADTTANSENTAYTSSGSSVAAAQQAACRYGRQWETYDYTDLPTMRINRLAGTSGELRNYRLSGEANFESYAVDGQERITVTDADCTTGEVQGDTPLVTVLMVESVTNNRSGRITTSIVHSSLNVTMSEVNGEWLAVHL